VCPDCEYEEEEKNAVACVCFFFVHYLFILDLLRYLKICCIFNVKFSIL